MNNIKIIELVNGEKLIAKVTNSIALAELVTDAMIIVPVERKQGEDQKFTFLPWPFFRDEESTIFSINKNTVVTTYEPNSMLLGNYVKATSNLILPPTITSGKLLTE